MNNTARTINWPMKDVKGNASNNIDKGAKIKISGSRKHKRAAPTMSSIGVLGGTGGGRKGCMPVALSLQVENFSIYS